MELKDLNREQVQQVKIKYLDDLLQEKEGRSISYGEMLNIDTIIKDSDTDFINTYSGVCFTEDDFFSNDIDTQSIEDTMFDLFDRYDEYDNIINDLRSLHSLGEITDSEYDYIITNYDNILKKWEIKTGLIKE